MDSVGRPAPTEAQWTVPTFTVCAVAAPLLRSLAIVGVGGVMDRSARDFPMPSFLQQITPFRYTVLDWEQARKIPAISYLTWIPSSTTWYRYAAMK